MWWNAQKPNIAPGGSSVARFESSLLQFAAVVLGYLAEW